MLISQSAIFCLSATWQRLTRMGITDHDSRTEPRASERRESAPSLATPKLTARAAVESAPARIVSSKADSEDPGDANHAANAPLTPNERRARAAALRALALSRGRKFDAARLAFIEASRLDPELDLTRTPSFWSLERAAHEAAIAAYVETGRDGDAAVLRARVRSTFRPKAVRQRVRAPLPT